MLSYRRNVYIYLLYRSCMILELVLWTLIPLILLFVIHHFFSRLFHIVFWIMMLFFVITLIGGIFLFLDAREFQQRMAEDQNLFLLRSDGTLVAGIEMSAINLEDVRFLDADAVYATGQRIASGGIGAVQEDNFKIFLFDEAAFYPIEGLAVSQKTYPTSYVLDLLKDEQPLHKFVLDSYDDQIDPIMAAQQAAIIEQSIQEALGIQDPSQFKGYLFALLLGEGIREYGPLYIIDQYRDGNIVIHEETMLFQFIKVIPDSLYDLVAKNANLYKPQAS